MLNLLDLFSGIGGFSLGLERTGGFKTVAFCEKDDYCRRVLRKHWPDVHCYPDITQLRGSDLPVRIDAMCGGFPCQDISQAGQQAGIDGERSGLWREYARLIGELRPQVVFVENVANLLLLGVGRVLGDLAAIGYDAEWHCIPASYIGACHRRDRIWITAYPNGKPNTPAEHSVHRNGSPTASIRQNVRRKSSRKSAADVCDADSARQSHVSRSTTSPKFEGIGTAIRASFRDGGHDFWRFEPDVGRVADGVPARVDRLTGLGNAVVPQLPELVGNAYLDAIGYQR